MTTYTKEASVSTTYETEQVIQSDEGVWLDELLNEMTDEDNSVIIFHTGDFYDRPSEYKKEEAQATSYIIS